MFRSERLDKHLDMNEAHLLLRGFEANIRMRLGKTCGIPQNEAVFTVGY